VSEVGDEGVEFADSGVIRVERVRSADEALY
jgi:hypothetical protein